MFCILRFRKHIWLDQDPWNVLVRPDSRALNPCLKALLCNPRWLLFEVNALPRSDENLHQHLKRKRKGANVNLASPEIGLVRLSHWAIFLIILV